MKYNKILRKCLLMTSASLCVTVAEAQTITLDDGQPGHVLDNQTIANVIIKNDGTHVEIKDTNIGAQLSVQNGGSLTINNVHAGQTTPAFYGLQVQGAANNSTTSKVTGSGLYIENMSSSARAGMYIQYAADIDLQNVHITSANLGIQLDPDSTTGTQVTRIRDFSITSDRVAVHTYTPGGELHLSNGTVQTTTNWNNGFGVHAFQLGGATVSLKNVQVSTTGNYGNGIYVYNSTHENRVSLDASYIVTQGVGSRGVYAEYGDSQVELKNNSSITTYGDDAYGISSNGDTAIVFLDHSEVLTEGKNAYGVFSSASGSTVLRNGATVVTQGENSHGVFVRWAGKAVITDSLVHAQGENANGINMKDGIHYNDPTLGSRVDVRGSTVISDQGYGIATQAGNLTINILDGSVIKGGAGLMDIQDGPAYHPGTKIDFLSDGGSHLLGRVVTGNNAELNMTLQGGSVWEFDDDSNVTTLTNRQATIRFAENTIAGSTGFNTLSVAGNYVGDNGVIVFNTVLGSDNSLTDKLVIAGDVSGNTYVQVQNRGGLGALTSEGIQLIEIAGQSPSDAFVLQGDYVTPDGKPAVVAGAYGYSLYQGSVANPNDGGWYLRSEHINTNTGGNTNKPNYQPGVPTYESYANVLHVLNGLPTLRERVGERQFTNTSTNHDEMTAPRYGVWARVSGSHGHYEPNRSTSMAEYDIDIWRMQIGADLLAYSSERGNLVAEVSAHYGDARSDVSSVFGRGKIDATGYGLGAALTWYGNNGFYVDAQAQVTWFDSDLSSSTLGVKEVNGNDGLGFALGIEAGQSFKISDEWSLTPQAQLIHSRVSYDDFQDAYGASVRQQNRNNLTGRLGLSADYSKQWAEGAAAGRALDAYGIVNVYQDFSSPSGVEVAGIHFEQRNERTWAGVGVGATYSWKNGLYALYGKADVRTSMQDFGKSYGVAGVVGVRMRF